MLDSAKLLTNVCSVNNYDVVKSREFRAGSTPQTFYVQLWQNDLGIRYIPASGSALTIEFLRADTTGVTPVSQTVTKTASLAFSADDRSIWSCALTSTDLAKIVTGGYRLTLVEGTDTVMLFLPATIKKIPSSSDPN